MLTDRLELVPATLELCDAEIAGPTAVARTLGALVPVDWPPPVFETDDVERIRRQLRDNPTLGAWTLHYVLRRAIREQGMRSLVGVAGYAGPPTPDGHVEVGYAIVEEHQRLGYATEAVTALISYAFADPRVRRIVATTYDTLQPSIRVLQKTGFVVVGADDRGLLRFERRRASPV